MKENDDTIAAIATPFGNSGIGIIRISGNDAIKTADKIIRSRSNKSLDLFSAESHTVHYGYLVDKDSIIDEVLCTVYRAPRSYTAEDIVEISCHGGMYILNKALSVILSNGLRLAKPGEFTKRAFLNGRIDLSQAESVMDIISSENEFSRKNSISHLTGSVKKKVNGLRETIIHETAFIEAALDDPDNYETGSDYKSKLEEVIIGLSNEIKGIIDNYNDFRFLRNGINTVIVGKPNVGKSSLLNLLSGYDRAIVTSVPGTTRDTLSERIKLDDIILNIIDTAGIHKSNDEVEKAGILRSRKEIEKADLILFIIDLSEKYDEEDREIACLIKEKNSIVILNKADKKPKLSEKEIKKEMDFPIIKMSVKENKGLDKLKDTIKELFIKEKIKENTIHITNMRQIELFKSAYESLCLVAGSIKKGMSEEMYTIDLMDAYAYLGEIIGEDISDDLCERIFNEFCMGK